MADERPTEHGAAWEMVLQEPAFQTERLKVTGGWIYRCRGTQDAYRAGTAMCFVPQFPLGDKP